MRNTLRFAVVAGILAILACDRAAEPRQVATPEASPPAPDRLASDGSATGPVVAHIDGERIEGFRGWYDNGILTLYTGRDPNFDYGEKISFWHLPHEPAGQRVRYPAPEGAMQAGQMTYAKHDPAVNLSTQWLKDYAYDLRIGQEKDFLVKVSLEGRAESPVRVQVSGTVGAMTTGIKMVDGVVDRSFDHLDTIQWLTRAWIEERHRPQAIAERPDHCMMENAPKEKPSTPRRQVAACSYLYTDYSSDSAIAKLWFEKQDGQWREVSELQPEQLFRANPIKPPRDRPPWVLAPIAAQRFQETVYAEQGGFKRIAEPALFPCGGGQREGHAGWCEITYPVYPKDRTLGENDAPSCQVVTYVFARDVEGQWGIAKILGTAQKFNRKTQQVTSRDKIPEHCG